MDALDAIESVRKSKTLQRVLGAILAIGNFLNNTKVYKIADYPCRSGSIVITSIKNN